jgi:hypothetical protein
MPCGLRFDTDGRGCLRLCPALLLLQFWHRYKLMGRLGLKVSKGNRIKMNFAERVGIEPESEAWEVAI